jgi:aminoglycoside 6'-N-acetyltransferase I
VAIKVRQANISHQHELAAMCVLLWPGSSIEEHRAELAPILLSGKYGILPFATFLSQHDDAVSPASTFSGFIQVGLRSHADGCDFRHPVGFVEGWFVRESHRRQGIGKALMQAAEEWARTQGCREMASDTWIDHQVSIDTHQALGFEIVDRCVHFRKPL